MKQVIDISVAAGVPCAHTAMVGFETTNKKWKQMQGTPAAQRRRRIVRWAVGGAAGIGVVTGVAAGLAFGDVASTLANTSVADVLAAGSFGEFADVLTASPDCCGDCGECGECCANCAVC